MAVGGHHQFWRWPCASHPGDAGRGRDGIRLAHQHPRLVRSARHSHHHLRTAGAGGTRRDSFIADLDGVLSADGLISVFAHGFTAGPMSQTTVQWVERMGAPVSLEPSVEPAVIAWPHRSLRTGDCQVRITLDEHAIRCRVTSGEYSSDRCPSPSTATSRPHGGGRMH